MERRSRIDALAVGVIVLAAALVVQAATADPIPSEPPPADAEAYPGDTLITVQSYGWFDRDNGRAFVVNESGAVVWKFDPPDSRVFDAEMLDDGNVLVSLGTRVPATDCPPEYRDTDRNDGVCIHNRVLELDYPTDEVVWSYTWYDAFVEWHEVHDADRLADGRTVIADMGNDRAFAVNRDGEVVWSWYASNHLTPGTRFWDRYVPLISADSYRRSYPEADWTHLNDVDRLPNGNYQLSVRNFDVVLEVDPHTNRIVGVLGRPGDHDIMRHQHDPNRLAGGTVLVADSENDRVVERDVETGELVWEFTGDDRRLQWPRDADRLPNGNTLIVDSRNFRVIEVNRTGALVWEYSMREERGIAYDADRLGLPEEPHRVPNGWALTGTDPGPASGPVNTIESWAGFLFPAWVRFPELITIAAGALAGTWLFVEIAWDARDGRRGR